MPPALHQRGYNRLVPRIRAARYVEKRGDARCGTTRLDVRGVGEPRGFGGKPRDHAFWSVYLRPPRRRLARDGQDGHLTPKAFDLLLVLLDAAPRVLPTNELHARLWPGTFVADATLASVVKELRRALDDRDSARPIIRTLNRVGFAFACPVDQVGSALIARAHWLVGRDKRFPLQAGENMIGRDLASAVWLDVASVSRRHARIAITDIAATLEDLQSKNGTKVGDVMVTTPVALQNGDPIRIGTVPLTYRTSAEGLSTETHASAMHVDTPAAVPHASADSGRSQTAKR